MERKWKIIDNRNGKGNPWRPGIFYRTASYLDTILEAVAVGKEFTKDGSFWKSYEYQGGKLVPIIPDPETFINTNETSDELHKQIQAKQSPEEIWDNSLSKEQKERLLDDYLNDNYILASDTQYITRQFVDLIMKKLL